MTNINGKKLLILAGSPHEADLVRRAKELGVYTIVTDYYDAERSPAKKIADKAWDISWSDLDALEIKCKETGIDGVMAGYSEITVENMINLCKRLQLPCYITEAQLEITRDKILFKEECRKNGVPVIKEYPSPESVDTFPVIVKPVDRAGSIGISVANNKEELIKAYDYAMEMSLCKKVIIEEFITKGTKFDVVYAIADGEIAIIGTTDTINAKDNGTEKVVQSAWLAPSKYHKKFLEQADSSLRQMIRNMGITSGMIFFSGFADGESFAFFECGFRLPGGHIYRYGKAKGMVSGQDIFIHHALTGNTKGLNLKTNREDLKCVMLNFYAKAGIFSHYCGTDDIEKMPECYYMLPMCYKGAVCEDDKAILVKLAMVHLYDTNPLALKNAADKVYQLFKAVDTENGDMIFDRIDTRIIPSWWD